MTPDPIKDFLVTRITASCPPIFAAAFAQHLASVPNLSRPSTNLELCGDCGMQLVEDEETFCKFCHAEHLKDDAADRDYDFAREEAL